MSIEKRTVLYEKLRNRMRSIAPEQCPWRKKAFVMHVA